MAITLVRVDFSVVELVTLILLIIRASRYASQKFASRASRS